ncbi:MAG: hypothetical protein JRI23_11145 [Deltaproteobacteria bacterium]|jgi:mannose-6-phosphate isomerase-like protein (cupin superfamily)|nr:hypothetical protein [Deltaproteobacteria bacterium]MBW2532238.1 hypothetical protein [Deltaproteobacteria bacterium]
MSHETPHSPIENHPAPRRTSARFCPAALGAALVLALAVAGCSVGAPTPPHSPVTYSPEPMLSPEEWTDAQLAREVAARHLASEVARWRRYGYLRTRLASQVRRHDADVAIMVLDGEVTLEDAKGTQTLRRGSVVMVPAGARYRFAPTRGGSAVSGLIVGSAAAIAPLDRDEGTRVALLVP